MKSASWLWRVLAVTTSACLVALVVGFGWALKDTWLPQQGLALPGAKPPEQAMGGDWEKKTELLVTSMGDSLTKGTGDATGQGYVDRLTEGLSKAMDKPVKLVNNLAINGLRADQLVAKMDEVGYRNAIGKADIVVLTIGGNDLFQIAQDGGSVASGGDLSPEAVQARLPEATDRLKAVFEKTRELNKTARIVYVGLYNPFFDLPRMREASPVVADWNSYARQLADEDGNATVVATSDLFEFNIAKYLSSDHFHPNAQGYERIADRIVQALD